MKISSPRFAFFVFFLLFGGEAILFYLHAVLAIKLGYIFLFIWPIFTKETQCAFFTIIFRVNLPIFIGLALVFVYYYLHSLPAISSFFYASLSEFRFVSLLNEMLAALYAIFIAFLLFKCMTDYDNLACTLRDEANQIEKISGFIDYFDPNKGDNAKQLAQIRSSLLAYVNNVSRSGRVTRDERNTVEIKKCIISISKIEMSDVNDQIALSEIMRALSDLSSIRSKRISQMEIRLSPFLFTALTATSLALVYPFFSVGPVNELRQGQYVTTICIFLLGSLISFLNIMLLDISHPFEGYWKIKMQTFEDIKNELEIVQTA